MPQELAPFSKTYASLLALGVCGISLIAQTPAQVLAHLIDRYTTHRVILSQVSGTLWRGEAYVHLSNQERTEPLGHLTWKIGLDKPHPYALTIYTSWNHEPSGTLHIGLSQLTLQDINLSMPAGAVMMLSPSLNVAGLGGTLFVSIPSLQLARGHIVGQAQLTWRGLHSPLSPLSPLGHYQLKLQGNGDALGLQLSSIDGPLQLKGTGQWHFNTGGRMDGEASTHAANHTQLAPLLSLIGNPLPINPSVYAFHMVF